MHSHWLVQKFLSVHFLFWILWDDCKVFDRICIVILWVVGMNTHPMKNYIFMAKTLAPKLPFQSLMKFFRLQATTCRQVKYYFTFRYFINQFPFFWFSRWNRKVHFMIKVFLPLLFRSHKNTQKRKTQ